MTNIFHLVLTPYLTERLATRLSLLSTENYEHFHLVFPGEDHKIDLQQRFRLDHAKKLILTTFIPISGQSRCKFRSPPSIARDTSGHNPVCDSSRVEKSLFSRVLLRNSISKLLYRLRYVSSFRYLHRISHARTRGRLGLGFFFSTDGGRYAGSKDNSLRLPFRSRSMPTIVIECFGLCK
jgi:hypothetical protein